MEILNGAFNDGTVAVPVSMPLCDKIWHKPHSQEKEKQRGKCHQYDSNALVNLPASTESEQKQSNENKGHRVQQAAPGKGPEANLKYGLIVHCESKSITLGVRP
jgi:hypothetical protein